MDRREKKTALVKAIIGNASMLYAAQQEEKECNNDIEEEDEEEEGNGVLMTTFLLLITSHREIDQEENEAILQAAMRLFPVSQLQCIYYRLLVERIYVMEDMHFLEEVFLLTKGHLIRNIIGYVRGDECSEEAKTCQQVPSINNPPLLILASLFRDFPLMFQTRQLIRILLLFSYDTLDWLYTQIHQMKSFPVCTDVLR